MTSIDHHSAILEILRLCPGSARPSGSGPLHTARQRSRGYRGKNPARTPRDLAGRNPHPPKLVTRCDKGGTHIIFASSGSAREDAVAAGGITVSAVGSPGRRFGRAELISLVIGLVWGAGLVIAAVVVPVYQTSSVFSGGAATSGSATLVGVNGWGALLVAGAPLAPRVGTGGARGRRAGRPRAPGPSARLPPSPPL